MKLTKVDANVLGKVYRRTKLDEIIDEFIAAKTAVMKMEGWEGEYCSPYSCESALKNALKRRGHNHLKVVVRGGRAVFR